MGEVYAGRYELVDRLGENSVWRVWDRDERRFLAGQVLPSAQPSLLPEIVRGQRLDNPHLVRPLDCVVEADQTLCVMPLVRGTSLAKLLAERGALPESWARRAFDQLLQGLQALHDQGMAHRDVNPANILVAAGESADVLLTDLSTAASVGESRLTRLSGVVGTPGYISLEAFAGAAPDPKQDLYSAAVVLTEMLTGRRPSAGAVARGGVQVPASHRGTELGEYLARLLAAAPHRTSTAAQARAELAALPAPVGDENGVEVADQTPVLPTGWTETGPAPTGVSAAGRRASSDPSARRGFGAGPEFGAETMTQPDAAVPTRSRAKIAMVLASVGLLVVLLVLAVVFVF